MTHPKAPLRHTAALSLLVVLLFAAPRAGAQFTDERWDQLDQGEVASPERMVLELFAMGPYEPTAVTETATPAGTPLFDDTGPLFQGSLQAIVLRLPEVGMVTSGLRVGHVAYSASAIDASSGQPAGEETSLTAWLLTPLVGLRIDALARLGVPFLVNASLGYDLVPWSSETGGREDGSGLSHGLRWAVQLGLELDFAEPRTARRLDEDWGINHSFLFFELAGSQAGGAVPMGDALSWSFGLGFVL